MTVCSSAQLIAYNSQHSQNALTSGEVPTLHKIYTIHQQMVKTTKLNTHNAFRSLKVTDSSHVSRLFIDLHCMMPMQA